MWIFWIAVGVVADRVIPMPFLDEPIKKGWLWVLNKVKSYIK